MTITRRNLIKLLGTAAAVSTLDKTAFSRAALVSRPAVQPRIPLDEFVQNPALLAALRLGVQEMKKRKPSDPLSWFYQAAIHGVTDAAIKDAQKTDSNITPDLISKMWNQCPHNGQNSANFLPWHRAYTYHFERIIRMHTGMSDFSLPYWNYVDVNSEDKRTFPQAYGVRHLDGNLQNNDPANINPLYLYERDFYFCNYEHPNSTGLPLTILSRGAVDVSKVMTCPVFFGPTETEGIGGGIADTDPSTRGLVEKYPHDQIHRSVGGIVQTPGGPPDSESVGAMANPPTAAFDPIFSVHHTTIDWIWVQWSLMPGKSWGTIPGDAWFNERPWFFADTDGTIINQPRKAYFDHRALGISYKYEGLTTMPLKLPEISNALTLTAFRLKKTSEKLISRNERTINVSREQSSVTPVPKAILALLQASRRSLKSLPAGRIMLRLDDVQLGKIDGTGYNLYLTTHPQRDLSPDSTAFIGSIVLFSHEHSQMPKGHEGMVMPAKNPQLFDATKAINTLDTLAGLSLIIKPFSLYEGGRKPVINEPLRIRGLEFVTQG